MKTIIFICLFVLSYSMQATGILISKKNSEVILPTEVNVHTTIKDQVAETVSTQTFFAATNEKSMFQYAFSLNPKAVVTKLQWNIKGKNYQATITGSPMDTVQGGVSNSGGTQTYPTPLKQYLANSGFMFSFKDSVSLKDSIRVEITYIELLEYTAGKVIVIYPLSLQMFQPKEIQCTYTCEIASSRKILDIQSVQYQPDIIRDSNSAVVTIASKKLIPNQNIRLDCWFDRNELGVVCYSNMPSKEKQGYMTLMIEPKIQEDENNVIKKVFTFVIDISGSMVGEKLENAKKAVHYCINRLNNHDVFNIIAFNSSTRKFSSTLVEATPDNVMNARTFIDKLYAEGGTDIQNAVLMGLIQDMSNETANVIVLLTDGQSSVNQNAVKAANNKNTRIYVFGVGSDVDKKVLNDIAMNNNGLAEFVTNSSETESTIGSLYSKIRNPIYKNLTLHWSRPGIIEVYPLIMQDIYMGEQMIITGMYSEPGPIQLTLKAEGRNNPVEFTYSFVLSADSTTDKFTPKVWATYKINELLRMMNSEPQGSSRWNEWKKEIISLGIRYGIVTKFTSFADLTPEEEDDDGNTTTWVPELEQVVPDKLRIFPNPVSGNEHIYITINEIEQGTECTEVILESIDGRSIALESGWYSLQGNILTIALPDSLRHRLSAGVYIIRIRCQSETLTGKIILLPAR